MLNEVNVKIKLIRSNNAFCLMAVGAQQFKVVLTTATLLIRTVKISPSVSGPCENSREQNVPSNQWYARHSRYLPATWTSLTKNCFRGNCQLD